MYFPKISLLALSLGAVGTNAEIKFWSEKLSDVAPLPESAQLKNVESSLRGGRELVDAIDLQIFVSKNGGAFEGWTDTYNPPEISNIPCGGSKTISFRIVYKGTQEQLTCLFPDGTPVPYCTIPTYEAGLYDLDAHPLASVTQAAAELIPATEETGVFQEAINEVNDGIRDNSLQYVLTYELSCSPYDENAPEGESCVVDEGLDGGKSTYATMGFVFLMGDSGEFDGEKQSFKVSCESDPSTQDDPHYKTWNGKWYDYMGECDTTFIDAPNFAADTPMRINTRTKIRYDYSFIESAVLAIGDETFEVGSWGQYFINGVEGARLPNTVGGYKITEEIISDKLRKFHVHIGSEDGQEETIEFKVFKDWVSIALKNPTHNRYAGSGGMIGWHDDGKYGKLMGRDGESEFEDINAFAQEWQVRADEPMLFHTVRMPQAPEQCILPTPSSEQRRLEGSIPREQALAACEKAGWSVGTIEMCVHDVMATGELETAEAGAM